MAKNAKGKAQTVLNGSDAADELTAELDTTMINGGDGDDDIMAGAGAETVHAGDGDDTITGGEGDDTLFGNDGHDTAVFSGNLADYEITQGQGNSWIVEGADGTDTLKQIETLQFDDHTYVLGENNGVFTAADAATTDEDSAVTIDVTANDFDFEGDDFSIVDFDATSDGGAEVTIDEDGNLIYDPSAVAEFQALGQGESTTDTFTYTVEDAAGNQSTETVTVTVEGSGQQFGFEDGLAGWETLGAVSQTTATSTEGEASALLQTDGATEWQVEAFLGTELDDAASVGAAMKTTVELSAGDTVSFDWRLDTTDYVPFNDFAFFLTLDGEAQTLSDVASLGDWGASSGWQTQEIEVTEDGTYDIAFGVMNLYDTVLDANLYIDNVIIG